MWATQKLARYILQIAPTMERLIMDDDGNATGNGSDFEECYCGDLSEQDYPLTYSVYNFIIVICSMPVISLLGIFGNVLNMIIFSRPRLSRNSANTYLFGLAISDLFVCITGVFMFWIDSARAYIAALKFTSYLVVTTLPFALMAQTASVYLVVMASIDCYVKVYLSRRCPGYSSPMCSRIVVAGVFVTAFLYNSLRFGQFKLHECNPFPNATMLEICPTQLFFAVNVIYNVYMYIVIMTLLPFMLLSILNALIMKRVQRDARRAQMRQMLVHSIMTRHGLVGNGNGADASDSKDDDEVFTNDDVVTMIMVVLLFLACNTLALIINIVETFFHPDPIILNFLTDASNLLVIINSSVNFFIYLTFNQDYCDVFCSLFALSRNSSGVTSQQQQPTFLHHPCARRSMSLITSTTRALSFLHVVDPPERVINNEFKRLNDGRMPTSRTFHWALSAVRQQAQSVDDTTTSCTLDEQQPRIQENPLCGDSYPDIPPPKYPYNRTMSENCCHVQQARRLGANPSAATAAQTALQQRQRLTPYRIVCQWRRHNRSVLSGYAQQMNGGSHSRGQLQQQRPTSMESDTLLTDIHEETQHVVDQDGEDRQQESTLALPASSPIQLADACDDEGCPCNGSGQH